MPDARDRCRSPELDWPPIEEDIRVAEEQLARDAGDSHAEARKKVIAHLKS